ncbi:CASP-like protein 4D1 [Rosa sericea]
MSKAIPALVLVFRILTLAACVASGLVLVLDKFKDEDGDKLHFYDIITFRYVLSAAAIGATYSLLQLPFNIYYACTNKRLIRNRCMPEFDFYSDKVVTLVLASGVGAGFAAGFELKKFFKLLLQVASLGIDDNNFDQELAKFNDFFEKAIISSGILLVGAVCMAVVSILTSITRTSNSGFFG